MFPHDSAKTIYGRDIFMTAPDGFSMLRPPRMKKEAAPAQSQADGAAPPQTAPVPVKSTGTSWAI